MKSINPMLLPTKIVLKATGEAVTTQTVRELAAKHAWSPCPHMRQAGGVCPICWTLWVMQNMEVRRVTAVGVSHSSHQKEA